MMKVLPEMVGKNMIVEIISTDKSDKEDNFYVVILDRPGKDKSFEEYEGKDLIVSHLGNPISKILGLKEKEGVEINGSKFRIERIVRQYREEN